MICPNCKAEIADGSKFCTRCGTKMEAKPEVKEEPKEEAKPEVKEEPKEEAKPEVKEEPKEEAKPEVKEEPKEEAKPEVKEEPKEEAKPEVKEEAKPEPKQEAAVKCIKCGAPLKAGAKFCTKCGTNQQAGAQPAAKPVQSAPKQTQPVPKQTQPVAKPAQPVAKPAQPAAKPKSKLPLVLLILFILILAILVGGYFVLVEVFDVNPIEMIMGDSEGDTKGKDRDKKDKDEDDGEGGSDKESGEDPEDGGKDAEKEKGDPKLLDEIDTLVEEAEKLSKNSNHEGATNKAMEALRKYSDIAEENNLQEEAADKISKAFDIASKSVVAYCSGIEKQEVGTASYNQIINTIDPVLAMAASLKEKGYKIDADSLYSFNDGIIPHFKKAYIEKINEITEREQWSRDEAWTYAEQAYSTQRDGKMVLFDETDLDDPLRLRYAYCLARISQKRCENGIADGSMSKEDAFNAMVAILKETDYNLLILQDVISYGSASGQDVSDYRAAYNAIVDYIKREQNLSILNSGVNSGTSVDVKSFWYFSDLDDARYQVDVHNGTTKATREWIRENIPSYIE